ncbi:hypothetical protein A2130_03380 [Candidatus Woesebacteria bacterium GWC2_33_12]|uniref:Transposase IS200-like domain-containing protein n=1 Tax=Candidatus Woesebacteria bacterium GW2011_GWB1_33_22 TaxID=1618566 RepID=A0A0F9ZZS8_9BACT|nr:MAG: hypothetical protein UR29_C0004G0039 [Candidatus Woesebacteria bacterium GW2011_GWC2_33_12]KKP41887.1 MAG: hypothetical protein UR33_C0008G0006 [Candidatus Woesebacteria bacterium GW2011_GWA2_33_20]KKP44461.1 MAG: hypothetical protein UR35_C0008G0006 [Candidatus Woesebacteria bacterium GW2011_GWB1_33_22]KKP46311.1 MAG: hypothetical protein UR37_C0009G0006 [Microgenomates group bacterium GW2011_GWC1_33_28]KKP50408.1 MAG: hypothetical protein UR41_C0008G0006 [Candidatus Woesebacteria bact
MPAKNVVKFYIPNSIYHIYNRGVNKMTIFEDDQDHKVFLNYLKEYLSPPPDLLTLKKDVTFKGVTFKGIPKQIKNYSEEISLLAFCLMPNHIHLLIKQADKNSVKMFTQSLFTRYSMYFNKKYKRNGPLFQSTYKATNVINKDYLLDITRYIHKNPLKITKNLVDYYSSYAHYLNQFNIPWIKNQEVLDYFNESSFIKQNKVGSYKDFVENFKYKTEELDLESDTRT